MLLISITSFCGFFILFYHFSARFGSTFIVTLHNIFGEGLDNAIAIQVEAGLAKKLLRENREGSKLRLELDGQNMPVQLKEKMVDSISNDILNLNFQVLKKDQKVNSVIHILLDHAEETKGLLERMLMEIPYASLPADMIDTITLDVAKIPVGAMVTVGDIPQLNSDKIELQVKTDEIVLRINAKRMIAETVEPEEP